MSFSERPPVPPATMTIRPVEIGDAAELWACEAALVRAGIGMVIAEEDLRDRSSFEAAMLSRITDRVWHAAVVAGRVIGDASVQRLGPSLCAHVGIFAIGIHPDAQGRGRGRVLSESVIAAAFESGISRLELYVRADNPRAIGLYESLGFAQEGRRVGFIRLPDGRYVDDLTMVRFSG